MLLERRDGEPYEGTIWPGATVFPDFAQPRVREAWGRLHRPLVAAGVAGVYDDPFPHTVTAKNKSFDAGKDSLG